MAMWMARRRLVRCLLALTLAVPVGATSLAGGTRSAADRPAVADARPQTDERTWSPEARAMAAARRTGKRVEMTTLRTETGQVFANPDGTKTMEQHAVPVRVRKGSGWVAPDPTLRRRSDGTVRPVATVSPIILSGGGSSSLLAFGKPGARVRLGWPGTLPAPRLHGDTATYPEVLPGVDLQIKVGVERFSHLLVVKNHAAALNPALHTLRYPIRGEGLTMKVRPDGTTAALDNSGRPIYAAPPPMMWDSTAKQARLGIRLSGNTMQLTPNGKLLVDPTARFPLYIDPSLSGALVDWLHVNPQMLSQNAWTYDRVDTDGVTVAKVGRAYRDTDHLYRSMFLLSTTNGPATIAGSTILGATFRITLNKTPGGTPTPVELWRLNDLDRNTYIDWGNQEGYWRGWLETRDGEAWPHTEDNPIEFGHPTDPSNLRNAVQEVATGRRATFSLGLRAPDEGTSNRAQDQWKKFHPNTAVLSITYNNPPRAPKGLNFYRPKPCGTAVAPTRIGTRTPQFSAVANDPDHGDQITTHLYIEDAAGTKVMHDDFVGPTVTGAAFSWPEVPSGKLADNVVYRYRAFSSDSQAAGQSTPDCYFVIDSVPPHVPQMESTDFPVEDRALRSRTVGTVTLRPGGGDTDIKEYLYGFDKTRMVMRVKAGPDGSATIPAVVWQDPGTSFPTGHLYVAAFDRAGNRSLTSDARDLEVENNSDAVPDVRHDVNGDGKADITAVFDHGFGRTAVWNVTSSGTGFHTGVVAWDAGEGGGYALSRTRPVQGDWDGDGRTDMAMFRQGSGGRVWLDRLLSDSNRFHTHPGWDSEANSWALNTARTTSGDVDGDRRDDIVAQLPGTGGSWRALVFRGANNLSQPVSWLASGAGPWADSAPLLADVDGDKKADLLSMRNMGNCRTVVELYKSTGTAFATTPITVYDGSYCWERSKPAVADVDGDGKDDIVAMYEHAPHDAALFVFRSVGTGLLQQQWWRRSNELDLSKATLTAGDFDVDGKEDAAIIYADGQVGDRSVFTFRSTGAAFDGKSLGWRGEVGAVTGPKFDIEHRQYELVNRNSQRCLNVEAVSTLDQARYIQWECLPRDLNARFQLEPVAGTDQYALRPAHTAVDEGPTKCADVGGWSHDDGAQVIQWRCGNGNGEPYANQQVTFEYVDGSAYDTVVQVRFAHSGKCLTIKDASKDDRGLAVQQTCGQLTNQQWTLRPAFNPIQLGRNGVARHRVEAATSANVLDVIDCKTADQSPIRMWQWLNSPCQKWQLESLGDDVYKIIDPNSGKALEIAGCSKLPGATVFIFTSNESECEKWRIEPTPGGSFSVRAVSSGLSLDVAGCKPDAGTGVITWFYHGGKCQRWFFKEV